jgi:hypothetical protein
MGGGEAPAPGAGPGGAGAAGAAGAGVAGAGSEKQEGGGGEGEEGKLPGGRVKGTSSGKMRRSRKPDDEEGLFPLFPPRPSFLLFPSSSLPPRPSSSASGKKSRSLNLGLVGKPIRTTNRSPRGKN